jgi:outer membrane protein TolC
MRKIIIPAILLWLGIHTIQAQTRLSIEDCRRMALENSDELRISSLKVDMAVSDRQAARTSFFPKITGSATYAHIFENINMGMEMDMSAIGAGIIPIPMEMSLNGVYMAGISLQQPVYAGGRIVNGNKMAKTGVAISEENKRLTRIHTLVEVEQAYWMYVSVSEKVKLLTQYTVLLDSLYQRVSNLYELEMATAQDLQKVRTRRTNITYERQRAESGWELTRMSLCHLTGLDLNTPVIATDTLIAVDSRTGGLSPDIANRPEIRMLQMQVEIKDLEIKNTLAGFLPSVGISAGYQYMGGMKFAGSALDMKIPIVMASISIPIFHFGEGRKKMRSARLAHEISTAELNRNSALMLIEARQARSAYESALLLIRTAEEGLREAEQNLSLAQNNYELKMATILDLMEAQTQWQEAYSNDIEARTNYKIREVEYLKAIGKLE